RSSRHQLRSRRRFLVFPLRNKLASMYDRAVLYALVSAALFGLSIPAAKVLLGAIHPAILAGLLYSGAGIGIGLSRRLRPRVGRPPFWLGWASARILIAAQRWERPVSWPAPSFSPGRERQMCKVFSGRSRSWRRALPGVSTTT